MKQALDEEERMKSMQEAGISDDVQSENESEVEDEELVSTTNEDHDEL